MKKLFPTSTVGSLPKPSWLAETEKLWPEWKLEGDALLEGKQDALRVTLMEQMEASIDIVSDGEQTRQHFVTTFTESLAGVDFAKRTTMRIRNRYDAQVPSIVGPVSRKKSVFVEDAKFLRSLTDQPIKWTLPGPMTIIDTLYDAHYKDRATLAMVLAEILNQEAKELAEAGVDIIQFDEPAFNVFINEPALRDEDRIHIVVVEHVVEVLNAVLLARGEEALGFVDMLAQEHVEAHGLEHLLRPEHIAPVEGGARGRYDAYGVSLIELFCLDHARRPPLPFD